MFAKFFKPWLTILLAAAVCAAAAVTLNAERHTVKRLVYTDDYLTRYAAELRMIFGGYTLGERTEKHVEGEDCSCGYHRDTLDYWEWPIVYTDACGQEIECTLNNKDSISVQQYDWLQSQIEAHICREYLDEAYFDTVHPAYHYLGVRIGNIADTTRGDEQWKQKETADAYKEKLLQGNELLALHSLSFGEIFGRFPIRISAGIMLEHEDVHAESINANLADAVSFMEDRINRMRAEIGDNMNMDILIYTNTRDPAVPRTNVRFKYIRGRQADPDMDPADYQSAVYRSYIGKYW